MFVHLTIEMRERRWWNVFHLSSCFEIHYWKSKGRLFLNYLILASSLSMMIVLCHFCCPSQTTPAKVRRLTMAQIGLWSTTSFILPLLWLCHTWTIVSKIQVDSSYMMSLCLFGLSACKRRSNMRNHFIFISVPSAIIGLRALTPFRHSS